MEVLDKEMEVLTEKKEVFTKKAEALTKLEEGLTNYEKEGLTNEKEVKPLLFLQNLDFGESRPLKSPSIHKSNGKHQCCSGQVSLFSKDDASSEQLGTLSFRALPLCVVPCWQPAGSNPWASWPADLSECCTEAAFYALATKRLPPHVQAQERGKTMVMQANVLYESVRTPPYHIALPELCQPELFTKAKLGFPAFNGEGKSVSTYTYDEGCTYTLCGMQDTYFSSASECNHIFYKSPPIGFSCGIFFLFKKSCVLLTSRAALCFSRA
eukprot:TRINITY_DN1488_c0_g1_i2.p1 TRINITY_DN1488_c0_g1~~TRINITY_DN1488_c0_g1_i2.p1  ORF type:complete len:302 (-),score=72.68 TRINITY_DN1488_c0_g1_i2:2-805(-)